VKFTLSPDNAGALMLFEDETISLGGCCGGTAGSTRPAVRTKQNGCIGVDALFTFSDSIPLTPLASTADTLALLPHAVAEKHPHLASASVGDRRVLP
jgi:hypothetical protein